MIRKWNAVKESFDNLPSGVCFFDNKGFTVLCNHQMYNLAFDLIGKDLQSLPEFEQDMRTVAVKRQLGDKLYSLNDGTVWQFLKEDIKIDGDKIYTQLVAFDVTNLYAKQKELEQDNQKLRDYAQRMKRLSSDIITLIREEEILNMKMRVHDDIGRSVIETRRLLQQKRHTSELDISSWKKAVRLLKHDTQEQSEEGEMSDLSDFAQSIGVKLIINASLPTQSTARSLVLAAIRQQVTNAARHVDASEAYVSLSYNNDTVFAIFTNNGDTPKADITEGVGLSSLRAKIEKHGGEMKIFSVPEFRMEITIPLRTEEEM